MDQGEAQDVLETLDSSIFFVLVIVGSVLLSLLALCREREEVRQAAEGEAPAEAPSVFPLRLGASALVVGALGFFLCLALARQKAARLGDDPAEARSADSNAVSSALVLAAALLRLDDLLFLEGLRREDGSAAAR